MIYKPKTEIEKFGLHVYNLLVDNFPQTFYVGGVVRNMFLKIQITDIDIATEAKPEQVITKLRNRHIEFSEVNKNFGVIVALSGEIKIEVVTFRKEIYLGTRYPHISYIQNVKTDSNRRDFTANALYLSPETSKVWDFHKGLEDLKKRVIRFIGKPHTRILEDPLRIIRALRFALNLNFSLEKNTREAIKEYFNAISYLTHSKLDSEIEKAFLQKNKKILREVINNPKMLDKYFI
jgi:tRNA nucleotidyltransferase/poly(A) polymerase